MTLVNILTLTKTREIRAIVIAEVETKCIGAIMLRSTIKRRAISKENHWIQNILRIYLKTLLIKNKLITLI